MSNSAWSDMEKGCSILKLHDKCPNLKCNCQKIITFTPNQYMLEEGSIKNKLKTYLKVLRKLGRNFQNRLQI